MSASTSVPATIEIRRSRLVGLVGLAAALAAAVTWVVLAVALDSGSSSAAPSPRAVAAGFGPSPMQDAAGDPTIMSVTPAQLAAGALGTGYQLPAVHRGPTVSSVLASMSPETRRYTKAVMALTFRQLAAGAAGHP